MSCTGLKCSVSEPCKRVSGSFDRLGSMCYYEYVVMVATTSSYPMRHLLCLSTPAQPGNSKKAVNGSDRRRKYLSRQSENVSGCSCPISPVIQVGGITFPSLKSSTSHEVGEDINGNLLL